jgi:hypothetical protein
MPCLNWRSRLQWLRKQRARKCVKAVLVAAPQFVPCPPIAPDSQSRLRGRQVVFRDPIYQRRQSMREIQKYVLKCPIRSNNDFLQWSPGMYRNFKKTRGTCICRAIMNPDGLRVERSALVAAIGNRRGPPQPVGEAASWVKCGRHRSSPSSRRGWTRWSTSFSHKVHSQAINITGPR